MLLITCVDEYLGYCIASHLAQIESIRKKIRVVYQKQERTLPWVKSFVFKGIDVVAVDYSHPDDISRVMRNVDQMILCLNHHPNRVQHAQNMCKIAIQSRVQSIIYLSHVGAQIEHYGALYDYGLIENYLIQLSNKDDVHTNWTILRLDWIQQYFHLWSCQVETKRNLMLPLKTDSKISPVDITDVCLILTKFVIDDNNKFVEKLNEIYANQVYTITGPDSVTPVEIVQLISNATKFQNYKYQMTRPMDTTFYLKELCHNIWFDEKIKKEARNLYADKLNCTLYRHVLLGSPKDKQIQTFLNYFDWINQYSGSVSVEHTQQLLVTRKSSLLQDFFMENANSFKPKI